ncbi:MAG TPA: arylsulfatase [Prolixibacteraceae bacterium]|nr:arylsulfatase [Prolixibacteraceae bacterium]
MLKFNLFLTTTAGVSLLSTTVFSQRTIQKQPNILVILADDLGYGDVSCYGAKHISTPNIDRLAKEGLRFTNGFATSATCTPSRYALLTGIYPWRKKAAVLPGDAPLIIEPQSLTLPRMLQNAGYTTGVVGKWHLGLGNGNTDWNQKVVPGANETGFNYSFIQAATNDRVPCVYLENGLVVDLDPKDPISVSYKENFTGEPTGKQNPELLKMHPSHGHDFSIVNGISRIGYMKGGKSAHWIDENMADTFLTKSIGFIKANRTKPFFLYYALHQPHVPRVPNSRFVGKSGMGPRGDAILEADWCIGKMLDAMEEMGLNENTLIIFSSDNGPVIDDGYKDQAVELLGNHIPAGPLRGGKYSMFEGGTRVPFIVRWKGAIKPGVSDALVCQMDFLASFSDLLGQKIDKNVDSKDVLQALLGKTKTGRSDLVIEGMGNLAYKQGDWVLIPKYKGESYMPLTGTETGRSGEDQLYHLSDDLGERVNLAGKEANRVVKMKAALETISGIKPN